MTDTGDFTPAKQRHLAPPWPKGVSGNPAGRPKSARSRLSENYIAAMAADFEKHGVAVIEECRRKHPVEYLQIISRLLPARAELDVSVSQFHDVRSVVQAHRLALSIVRGNLDAAREYAPQLEHDDG